jgi:hypothetical protein
MDMSERKKYEIAVNAKMSGARRGDVIVLNDGSRWKLDGLTVVPA